MPVTVFANARGVAHKGSAGFSVVFPDVCKTPTPGGPVPIPYPNVARIASAKQEMAKNTSLKTQVGQVSGNEVGSAPGVMSNKIKGKAEYVNYSMDVKYEGKNGVRTGDVLQHSAINMSAPAATVQSESAHLRNMLNDLHFQLMHLPPGNPEVWEKVLQDYALTAGALYQTITSE